MEIPQGGGDEQGPSGSGGVCKLSARLDQVSANNCGKSSGLFPFLFPFRLDLVPDLP